MRIEEARRLARITTYTFDDGVEHRRPAFPMAMLSAHIYDMATTIRHITDESFPRLTEKFRLLGETLSNTPKEGDTPDE